MACNIIKSSDGTNTVVDANGNSSILYDNLIQLLNEYPYVTSELIPTDDVNNLALQYYELSNTPEFRSKYNLTSKLDVEVSIDDIINHINTEYSFNETQEVKEGVEDFNINLQKIEKVAKLIENKLKIKEKKFRGNVSDKFITKEDYLDDIFKKLIDNIGLPESITNLEELKQSLNDNTVLEYINKEYNFYNKKSIESKDSLDELNSDVRVLNNFLKSQKLDIYDDEQQLLIKKSFPALFEDLGNFKSKNQALSYYKKIVNTPVFLNKVVNLQYIKMQYFTSQSKLTKFENLLNYNTLAPNDFQNRIYNFVENELNRRSEFFTSPKMQEVILAKKEEIAKQNYENSVKGLLERFSKNENTISGKISKVFLQHPNTLDAIKAENINRSFFGIAGGEWKGDGTINVSYKDEQSLRHILLHELTHHFTVPYIITYLKNYSNLSKYKGFLERFPSEEDLKEDIDYSVKELTQQEIDSISKLEDIYIHVLNLHKKGKINFTNNNGFSSNPEYGLENFYEFISEIISNPYFAAEIAKQPSLYNKKSNLLKDIINSIFKMFGIDNVSLLEDIYSLFEESFLNKDENYNFKSLINSDLTFKYKDSVNSDFGVNTKIDIPVVDKVSNEDKRNELDILLNAINKLKRDKVYSEKTINTITQMMRDIGFNMGSFEEIIAKSKKPYLKKENAIVDITAKMIHISEGGSVSDLLEEIGHVISAQLDGADFEQALELIKKDPKYTNEMQKYIAIYQSEEKYTGEDAINKAATEVLGQLIGEQLGNKLEENTDETLVGLIKRFIKRVLGVFKNQFDLHKYVEQSVDYFIQTPNRPFKRETHYYSLEKKRNELSDVIVNLKKQRSKVLQLRSKFDNTDNGLFESDRRKVVLDKQITFLTQEIMNNNTDRNVIDYLNEVLNDTNEIIEWLSRYKIVSTLDYKVNVNGEEKEFKQFVSDPNYQTNFNIANVSIRALSDARDYIHNYTYATTILDNIVNNNVRLTEGEKLAISTYITNVKSRLSFINNEVENLDKLKSQELIESLVTETGVAYDYKDVPQSIKNTLEDYKQEKDINVAETWFGPMGMVNSTLSRLVDGVFNLIYNNARIKTTDFSNTFLTKFKSYIGRDMSFVAEKYNGKTTGDFIDEYHWGQWNIARKTKLEELAKDDKYNFPKDAFDRGEEFDSVKVYNDYKKDLKAKLKELQAELDAAGKLSRKSQALQESVKKIEDLIKHYDSKSKIIDDYLEEIGKWYSDNTQPRHNVNEIIEHYRKILSADDFAIWYERNVIVNSKNIVMYYKGELIQPSNAWKNKDFNKLSAEQKRILSELKAYKKEFDDMVGLPSNTLMPQMYQSMLNSLYDGKLSNVGTNLKGQLKRAFTRTSDDTQFEPDQEMRHFQEDNRIVSYIGSRYTKRLNNPEHISTDILGSMIGYAQMAYEFKEKMQRIDQFELIAQKMKKTKYANTSNKLTSNSLEKLTNHLEVHMMGKEEKVREINIPGTNLNINVNKVVAKFNKWISHSNLALGFVTQTANIITSNINGVLETILGQHVTTKSSGFAMKEFTRLFTSETMKEFGKTIKTNKLDLMLRYFGLSESADTMFNDLNKHIMMRKPLSTVAYAGYELGSYYINGIALLSILNNNRFYDGKLYTEQAFKDLQNNVSFDSLPSAYDSIVIKNGKLELVGLKASELNLLINKVRDLSKKLDGKLTKEDYAMAHTNIIGMSALMHRNWMIDGAFRRLKAKGLNFKTGEIDEGYWVTTKDLIGKFLYSKEKLKVLANLRANYKNLSRSQQLGLNRTLLDLASIGAMVAVAALIFNGGDDDDDDEISQLLAYLSNRVLLEVSSFYNPFEILYAVTDPIVSARQMETLMHLGNAIKFEEIERGKWEGYTRAEKYWYSLIPGVKGVMQTQDTESSNQFLKNKQLSWLY